MSIKYLKGAIGVSFFMLNNSKNNKLFILADMHDKLPSCKSNNYVKINEWLHKKLKLNKYQILLEEIPRNKNLKLLELWSTSEHTIDLKNFYLKHNDEIDGIDIRVFLIPFSSDILDTIEEQKNKNEYDITLKSYLEDLFNFFKNPSLFKLKNNFKEPLIDKSVINHFNEIKKNFFNFINDYKNLLNKSVLKLYQNNRNIFNHIDGILNDCMEWYCCFLINYYHNKNINVILHAGLYHTNNINIHLNKLYEYDLIYNQGMTSLNHNISYDCLNLNKINNYI